MSLRINYNPGAAIAQRTFESNHRSYARAAQRLATGLRINGSADDAGGMAVSERLKNQVRGLNQAGRNAQDGLNLVQTAEGALAETHSILGRLRELAVQAANDTLTATDRANLQTEANQLVSGIERIATSTNYNGIALLDKNSAVSWSDGIQLQVGANQNTAANQLTMTISGARARDLGSVKALNQIDTGITATGAQSFTLGGTTVNYNAEADTIFDLKDAINAGSATHGVTASIVNDRLHLESQSSGATVAGDSAGSAGVIDQLFGSSSNAITNAASGATTLEDLHLTAPGTMTVTATAAAATGSTTLDDLGVTGGTLALTASTGPGAPGGTPGTTTLAEIGVIEASGNFSFVVTDGTTPWTVSVAYTNATTLDNFGVAIMAALRAGPNGANKWASYQPNIGIFIDLNVGASLQFDGVTPFSTDAPGGTLLTVLNLNTTPTGRDFIGPEGPVTAPQSESVSVTYASSDTLASFAANVQAALQAAGAVGSSVDPNESLAGATASFAGGAITIDAVGSGLTFTSISETGGGTVASILGGLAAGAQTTATNVISPADTETATVSYDPTDTLADIASKIAAAASGIGQVGTSLLASGAGSGASFNAGTSVIDIAGVDAETTLSFESGALRTALNLSSPDTSVSGTTSSSAAITRDRHLLDSASLTGITPMSSGTGGILDISTQTAASAAISMVDSAINQVSTARSSLGATQARLESASRTIAIASENAAAANSRIADADIAQSMSELVRAQILQQAGISVLAQANQTPSLVLQLIR